MPFYVRLAPDGTSLGTWKVDETEAIKLGVSDARNGPGTYFKAGPGESVWDAMRRLATSWLEAEGHLPFYELKLAPGQYHPRMARPSDTHPSESPIRNPASASLDGYISLAQSQLLVLKRQLERICQTVHPTDQTLEVYGHDIRNLLALACMEVEMHWRGVLVANDVTRDRDRFSTNDYVLLAAALRLNEYEVTFPDYPWLAPFSPFRDWGLTRAPSQEIPWFDAYNKVKHEREHEFARATLRRAFEAVAACAVMLVAQFGLHDGLRPSSEIAAFFHWRLPAWPVADVYITPYEVGLSAVSFRFDSPQKVETAEKLSGESIT